MLLDMDSPKLTDDPVQSLKNVQKWLIGLVDSVNECLCAISTENFTDDTVKKITSGVEGRVEDAEGNISTLQQTAEAITGTVANLSGQVSTVQQTVDGLSITTSGGTSYISGDHIRSGTIEGVNLICSNDVELVSVSNGEIHFSYGGAPVTEVGRIFSYNDSLFYIMAPSGIGLKISSGANMSIDAGNGCTVYIASETDTPNNCHIGSTGSRIDLIGDVYVNGSKI